MLTKMPQTSEAKLERKGKETLLNSEADTNLKEVKMKLVLDINVIISAIIKENSVIRALLSLPFLEFYLPEYALMELQKNEGLIIQKSGLEKKELQVLLKLLLSKVKVINDSIFANYYSMAESIIGLIDKKDIPYIALALAVKSDGIWTADKHFEKQNSIKIFTTEKILSFIA
jgi:predicted nucleic acid-binding protein